MRLALLGLLSALALWSQDAWAPARVDAAFQGLPYVLLVQEGDQILQRGSLDPEEALAPCSTFKLPHALIALKRGVIGPGKEWRVCDPRECHAANGRLGLDAAIRQSCVSYFRQVARELGPEAEAQGMKALGYPVVGDLQPKDGFWLRTSGLRITDRQQLGWIRRFYTEDLGAAPEHLAQVRNATRRTETSDWTLWGKTGSGDPSGPTVHGWFTGRVQWKDGHTSYVALLVKGVGQGFMGLQAQARLKRLLRK